MPNWTFNSVIIEGDLDRLEVLDNMINGRFEQLPSFASHGIYSMRDVAIVDACRYFLTVPGVTDYISENLIETKKTVKFYMSPREFFNMLNKNKDILNQITMQHSYTTTLFYGYSSTGIVSRMAEFVTVIYTKFYSIYSDIKDGNIKVMPEANFDNILIYQDILDYRDAMSSILSIVLNTNNLIAPDGFITKDTECIDDILNWYNANRERIGTKWIPDIGDYDFDREAKSIYIYILSQRGQTHVTYY